MLKKEMSYNRCAPRFFVDGAHSDDGRLSRNNKMSKPFAQM